MAIGVISASIPVNIGVTARHQATYSAVKVSASTAAAPALKDADEGSLSAVVSTPGIDDNHGESVNIKV